MSTNNESRSVRPAKELETRANTGEFAIGFIWLAFYLVAIVITIASPIISTSIEIAARH